MADDVLPYPPLTGEQLGGRYRVEQLIGRGAMSEVYRAEDVWEGGPVAVKVLRAGAADPARFEKEIRLLRRLRHDHLVSLCDAGEHRGLPYVVLDLLDRTVADAFAAGPIDPDEAARIGREVASALAYVHAAGIVHRDVKPSNLLLAEDGSARLADLGAARLLDGGGLTATGMTIGTPAYLAPEQVTGNDVGPPADVYALGLVLIEAVSGRRPFDGTHQEMLAARVSRRPVVPSVVPGSWRSLVAAMTDLDPDRRPSAQTVAERLAPAYLAAAGTETEVMAAGGGSGAPSPSAVAAAGVAGAGAQGDRTAVLPAMALPDEPASPDGPALRDGPAPARRAAPAALVGSRQWLAANGQRAALWAVLAVLLVGLLLGLLSSDGSLAERPAVATVPPASSTTTTVATTTVPTTVAVVPVAPSEDCRGGDCEDREDGEGRGKKAEGKDDD